MSLYGQDPELSLLASFLPLLEHRPVVDVGAERGSVVDALLRAGAAEIHAIEPEPGNAAFLRARFSGESRVTVHEYAVSSADAELELHTSTDASGAPISFGHTLLDLPGTDEIAWPDAVAVSGRSLASLVASGEIPARVGILKIDTEGHDLAVVEGMGELDCDVVMVEHWSDLPRSLGPCPWSTEEMTAALGGRGFRHFAFVYHRGALAIVKWDDGEVPSGSMGNLVFLHDRVLDRLLPRVLECASSLVAQVAVAAEELERERDLQAEAAAERLALIEQLERERDVQAQAAAERLALIEESTRERSA